MKLSSLPSAETPSWVHALAGRAPPALLKEEQAAHQGGTQVSALWAWEQQPGCAAAERKGAAADDDACRQRCLLPAACCLSPAPDDCHCLPFPPCRLAWSREQVLAKKSFHHLKTIRKVRGTYLPAGRLADRPVPLALRLCTLLPASPLHLQLG